MAMNFLEFEQPIAELEAKIEELKFLGTDASVNISEEIKRLQSRAGRSPTAFSPTCRPGRSRSWRAIRSGPIRSTTCP
jgi:acetyl-CoA carboxylase alpha subunit